VLVKGPSFTCHPKHILNKGHNRRHSHKTFHIKY